MLIIHLPYVESCAFCYRIHNLKVPIIFIKRTMFSFFKIEGKIHFIKSPNLSQENRMPTFHLLKFWFIS